MKHKMSRLESNKEVRRVLNKHGVNLSFCQYSCAGSEVRLTGWLCEYDGSDYNASQIESLITDFQRYLNGYTLVGEFENWIFSSDHINRLNAESEDGSEQEDAVIDEEAS